MNENLVSILVVSYNAERYIEKTLRSCLNQTYPDFEVLVLDNASKDRTVEIIRNLDDSRLTLFEGKENIGPYAGLNFLLDRARGEYIAIQDHDDVWFPEKITKQIDFLEKNKGYIACGTNTFYFYEKRGILILNKKSEITDFVDHTSLVFRNFGFRYKLEHMLSDEHFEKKILSKSGKIGCLQSGLTIHRIKGDGKNLSLTRFSFGARGLRDFFSVNEFSFGSFLYLFQLCFERFFSEKMIWFLRKKITQRKRRWVTLEVFQREYPNIVL